MPVMRSLDASFPIEQQLRIEASPVVLVNVFTLAEADERDFLRAWQQDAQFMKGQRGCMSIQLHRAIGASPTYMNYAMWESTEAFRSAISEQDFMAKRTAYPASVVATPHLFQKIGMPGICVP